MTDITTLSPEELANEAKMNKQIHLETDDVLKLAEESDSYLTDEMALCDHSIKTIGETDIKGQDPIYTAYKIGIMTGIKSQQQ